MAITRNMNLLGQMRLDVPHLRSLESAVANDFDVLAGKAISGKTPLVLKGFYLSVSNTVGNPAENLLLNVASGLIMHFGASEAGTIYSVSDSTSAEQLISTNTKVDGAFSANSTNYIGLDLVRSADSSTADLVQFLDADTKLETSQTVPLARTLQYKIVISTQNFTVSSNILPIAIVVTNSANNVVSITDVRKMMFRLGSGGDNYSATSSYGWGTRKENSLIYTGGSDPFTGEDKSINNLKSWMDAMMTSMWEVRGGEHWYSSVNRDNVKILYGPVSTLGDNWEFDSSGSPDLIKWEALRIAFENADNTGIYYNTITNNTAGQSFDADGLCVYVDLVRESNATIVANIATMQTVGYSSIPGRRLILAWRVGGQVYVRDRAYEIGRALQVATTSILGVVKLSRAASTPAAPIVISDTGGTITPPVSMTGLIVSAPASGNNDGVFSTAKGTGTGLYGAGGDSNGTGVHGVGGTTNGIGVGGVGTGTGNGIQGTGGSGGGSGVSGLGGATNGIGVYGQGGATNGVGMWGQGTGAGEGVRCYGGTSGALGLWGFGSNGYAGVRGDGNGTAVGGYFEGGTTNGGGVEGAGKGSGFGLRGYGGPTGNGVIGVGGTTSGTGVHGQGSPSPSGGDGVRGDASGDLGFAGIYGRSTAVGTATSTISTGVYGLGLDRTNNGVGMRGGYFVGGISYDSATTTPYEGGYGAKASAGGGNAVTGTTSRTGGEGGIGVESTGGLGGQSTTTNLGATATAGAGGVGIKGIGGTGGDAYANATAGTANSGSGGVGIYGKGGDAGTPQTGTTLSSGAAGYGGYFEAGVGGTLAVAIPNTQNYAYTSLVTGKIFVPATEFTATGGSEILTSTIGEPFYFNTNSSTTYVLNATVHLPPGIFINNVDMLIKNTTGSSITGWSNSSGFKIIRNAYTVDYTGSATLPTQSNIVNTTAGLTVVSGVRWYDLAPTATSINYGNFVQIYIEMESTTGTGDIHFYGLNFTYTYNTLKAGVV